jgi:hypothetical protein
LKPALEAAVSYTLTIGCGCVVYVASHPRTRIVHTRIIEQRGRECRVRSHDVGARLQLWELLPEPSASRVLSPHAPLSMRDCGVWKG